MVKIDFNSCDDICEVIEDLDESDCSGELAKTRLKRLVILLDLVPPRLWMNLSEQRDWPTFKPLYRYHNFAYYEGEIMCNQNNYGDCYGTTYRPHLLNTEPWKCNECKRIICSSCYFTACIYCKLLQFEALVEKFNPFAKHAICPMLAYNTSKEEIYEQLINPNYQRYKI